MARKPLRPLIRSGGFYPSRKWTPLVYAGGYTTANGGEEPTPPPIEKTVTGNPIHITDALAKPVQALSVALEPIQDLHGYDNPWPAGGGKTKFDSSLMEDASTGAKFITLNLKPNTAYTMSSDDPCKDNGTITDLFFCNMDESVSSGTNGVKLNKSITRTSDANGQLRVGYRCYEGWITPEQLVAYHTQVEEGSTPTAWTPFSNLCPISGFTGLNVYGTGKNLFDKDATGLQVGWAIDPNTMVAYQTGSGNYNLSDYTPIKGGQSYIVGGTTHACDVVFYDANKTALIGYSSFAPRTAPENACFCRFDYWKADNDTIQLELGSTATSYSP